MVSAGEIAWQNKTIPGASDFRGVLVMGLLAAWFYFVWQFLSLPPLAAFKAGLPPLLRFALAKGQYMPDFGMIVAGCAAFHFRRELRREWERPVAIQVYFAAVVPLIAYLAVGVALLEAVHLAGPAHAVVLPWQDRLIEVQFLVLATAIVFAFLWPVFLYWMWTAPLDIGFTGLVLALIYTGMSLTLGWHRLAYMWPSAALADFLLGVCLCTSMFRGVVHFGPVRGPVIILGWLAMLVCSILAGAGLFFLGFIMIVAGGTLGERPWFLPGERALLLWSRTALAITVVQPAVFDAWLIWGQSSSGVGWLTFLALAAAAQLLAVALYLVIEMPARRLTPVMPA
ncbi:hypothetical protein [Acidisoma sp.]|uniref:hypothetical protein n=1 Tax=Acidisoma sp. TaxID=1872115 RepID=UPI003B005E02